MKRIAIFLFFLCPGMLSAQKDAPVSGHAATLFDLLKKDYNSIDPTNRKDELAKDRTAVIAIFKGYLEDAKKADLNTSAFHAEADTQAKKQNELNIAKRNLEAFAALTPKDETGTKLIKDQIKELTEKVEQRDKEYQQARYEADFAELTAIKNQYSDNGFLEAMVAIFINKYKSIQDLNIDLLSASNYYSSIQKSIPFIGGSLSFETAIDGLARFLAKRIKEELTTYVIDNIKGYLNNGGPDDPFAEFKVLLPRTTAYLQGFNADQVINFINEIKQYIEDDLRHLLNNAARLRNTPRIQKLVLAHPELDFSLDAIELIPAIAKIKYPVDYFTFLENSRNIERWATNGNAIKKNIANSVKLVALLARSLIVVDNGEPRFAGVDFLTSYATEDNYFKLYTGFLCQQNRKYYKLKFEGKNTITFESIIKNKVMDPAIAAAEDLEKHKQIFRSLFTEASDNAERVFSLATEIRKASKGGKKIGADTAYNFIKSVVDFSEKLTIAADTLIKVFTSGEQLALKEKTTPYFKIANSINEMIFDVREKKYTTALIKGIELGATISNDQSLFAFYAIVSQIASTKENLKESSWKSVIQEAAAAVPLTLTPKLKSVFTTVGTEITKIEFYYKLNYADQSKVNDINEVKDICNGAAREATITVASLGKIKALTEDKEFQKLVVSFYSGEAISILSDKLKAELIDISFVNAKGDAVNLFDPALVNRFTDLIENYTISKFSDHFKNGLKEESDSTVALRNQVLVMVKDFLLVIPKKLDVKLHPNLVLLIHFVNDMAVAQTAEDVEKAIDAFALPAGSYAIKRKARYNISINSYPGLLLGGQLTYKNGTALGALNLGFTAPVGLSFSKGNNDGSSLGFYIPVIDIGAVTRLRLDDKEETEALPEFKLKNILSPGLFISYGFPKSIFSLNLGVQYGPQLKEIDTKNLETKSYESFFFGLGVVMDIPLFNLHTRLKEVKN